jgi:hypothetical protein
LLSVVSGERSNRTMSWGDPMAVANGRVVAIYQPVIIAIITIVVLVHDRPIGMESSHRWYLSMSRCEGSTAVDDN